MDEDRPRPILDAARSFGVAVSVFGGLVVGALGVVLAAGANWSTATGILLGAALGVVTAATGTGVAWGVAHEAEPLVTPLEDPEDDLGRKLVPAPDLRSSTS